MPDNPYKSRDSAKLIGPINIASAHPITPHATNKLKTRGGEEYIPRALVCETAGLLTCKVPDGGTITTYPLIAGTNPVGGMTIITAFTGTNLWGISE